MKIAICVNLTIVTTFPYTAWCSLRKSQIVKTDKPHQVRRGDRNSCTSTDLLSCSWLCMSSSLSSCSTSDLQANSEEEGRGVVEGKTGDGWGKKTTNLHNSQSLFKLTSIPLTTLALPAKFRLTGTHLPFCCSSGAPNSETKEDYRHHATHHDN